MRVAVILSTAKDLSPCRAQILRCAQDDSWRAERPHTSSLFSIFSRASPGLLHNFPLSYPQSLWKTLIYLLCTDLSTITVENFSTLSTKRALIINLSTGFVDKFSTLSTM